jgi:hypothetical protein
MTQSPVPFIGAAPQRAPDLFFARQLFIAHVPQLQPAMYSHPQPLYLWRFDNRHEWSCGPRDIFAQLFPDDIFGDGDQLGHVARSSSCGVNCTFKLGAAFLRSAASQLPYRSNASSDSLVAGQSCLIADAATECKVVAFQGLIVIIGRIWKLVAHRRAGRDDMFSVLRLVQYV